MATPSEKLAESLEALHKLQDRNIVAIRAKELTRTHQTRLLRNGFIQLVMKGWYISTHPNQPSGESTAWYTAFWPFCSEYLNERFQDAWCLSPEQSLLLHAGNWTVPSQLLIRSPKGNNKITKLPFNTSLFDTRYTMPNPRETVVLNGLRIYSIVSALIDCSPKAFLQYPVEIRAVLSTLTDASELLGHLLDGGHSVIAGRLVGAFRNIKRDDIADEILTTMRKAGYEIRENDPFETKSEIFLSSRERSPYVTRMQIMWQEMRKVIIDNFPKSLGHFNNNEAYLKNVDEIYVNDAYNSLSIEGYQVSKELIERVRSGSWDPENTEKDKEQKNALAAKGYWQAFQAVKQSISKVLDGENSGKVSNSDHRNWYRELFGPSITAGILKPSDLAGYRNSLVYIRGSKHVPPNVEAVRDLMPAFFELLSNEAEASVRIILGHFFFVNIHPYMDGNGRMGRFLMNLMLASGGYSWTIIPVKERDKYMAALEMASVQQDIKPFTDLVCKLIYEDRRQKIEELISVPRNSIEGDDEYLQRLNDRIKDIIVCRVVNESSTGINTFLFQAYVNGFAYALGISKISGYIEVAKKYVDNTSYNLISSNFVKKLIENGSMIEISSPKINSVVLYYDSQNAIKHAGIVQDIQSLSNPLIKSKWGINKLFEHYLFDVPKTYGNIVKYFDLDEVAIKKEYNLLLESLI